MQAFPLRTLPAHYDGVTAGALSRAGDLLLSGGSDRTVHLWSVSTGDMLHDWPADAGKVRALGVLLDGRFAYSGGYDRCVRIGKLPEAKLVAAFTADSAIGTATVTDDFGRVVAGDAQGCAHFLEVVGRPS